MDLPYLRSLGIEVASEGLDVTATLPNPPSSSNVISHLESQMLLILKKLNLGLELELLLQKGAALSASQDYPASVCDFYVRVMRPLFYLCVLNDNSLKQKLGAEAENGVFLRKLEEEGGSGGVRSGHLSRLGRRKDQSSLPEGFHYLVIKPEDRCKYEHLYAQYEEQLHQFGDFRNSWMHDFVQLQTGYIPWTVHLILAPTMEILRGWSTLEFRHIRVMGGVASFQHVVDRYPSFNSYKCIYRYELSEKSSCIKELDWGMTMGSLKQEFGAQGVPVERHLIDRFSLS
eukprot:TRINITY_DN4507_c3_g1_i1.p1 TRINITY_DN4507_c3_g1~~TRINITY_DN4507_c3_g1_i1.p1  ORF type:complete len:310 (-),score=38.11 TRINITY_DN4507_c3_g1_i1:597-1457(-)